MIRNSTNQISIKPRASTKAKLLVLSAFVLVLAASIYFAYSVGLRSGHSQFEQDTGLIKQLNATIETQQSNLDTGQEQMIFAERQKQIQEEAYKQMSNAYASSEQKNRYLGSRLDFYRSIISPEGGQTGPAIQSIEYAKEASEGGYNLAFDITLVQAIKHKVHVTGSLSVELHQAGSIIKKWPDSGSRNVNYQYFQQVSGVFESFDNLENASIKVILSLHDGSSIERSFALDTEQVSIATDEAT